MKIPFLVSICLILCGSPVIAGVIVTPSGIFVQGVIEGSGVEPVFRGDTIDYLTFEVTTTGPVRLIANDITRSIFLAMGQIIPGERFDIVPPPYLLFTNHTTTNPPEFTHILDPGIYLVQIAEEQYREGDLGPYFSPVNRSGGGFVASPYSFTLEGQLQALDFMEGNLNGTFTITHVPEPTVGSLILVASAALLLKRRDRRM